MADRAQPELLSLSFELWHPDCWALQVTDTAETELFAYGTLTDGQVARERYIVAGDSEAALDQTVETIRDSPLTTTVAELGATPEGPAIGSHTREIFVEFDADPPPTSGADSYPPHWFWSPPSESMTATITLTASETARPGSYSGTLTVWNVSNGTDSSTARTQALKRFVIEIADG